MRKFSIVVLMLLLAGAYVFADTDADVEVKASVKAEAKLELSYDLDDNDFIIDNSTDLGLTLSIVDKQTKTKGDGGGVIGFIEVSDLKISVGNKDTVKVVTFDEDDFPNFKDENEDGVTDKDDLVEVSKAIVSDPKVKAQVQFLGPALYIEVTNKDNKIDLDVFKDFKVFKDFDYPTNGKLDTDADPVTRTSTDVEPDAGGTGSVTLGTTNGIVDATVTLREDDGENGDEGDPEGLNLGATIDVKVLDAIGLGIKGAFNYDGNAADNASVAYGFAVSWKLDLGDTSNLKVEAGFEGVTGDNAANEISAHVGLDVGLTADVYFATDTMNHDIRAVVSTGTLIDSILKLTAELDLGLASDGLLLGVGVDFDLTVIKDILTPYANFDFISDAREAITDANGGDSVSKIGLRAGVKVPLIENVNFDVFYENKELHESDKAGKFGVITSIKI